VTIGKRVDLLPFIHTGKPWDISSHKTEKSLHNHFPMSVLSSRHSGYTTGKRNGVYVVFSNDKKKAITAEAVSATKQLRP